MTEPDDQLQPYFNLQPTGKVQKTKEQIESDGEWHQPEDHVLGEAGQSEQPKEGLHEPKAVQITRMNEKNKLVIDLEAIDKVFGNPEVKYAPICIYSIAGPLRTGKSLFMSLMLRYLQHKVDNKESNWQDDKESILNNGFKWKEATSGVTQGIYIWNQPFWMESKTQDKVAVFLMDTQGLFDKQTPNNHDVRVFTLSTFLCSCQIYNLKSIINTNDLEKLQLFSQFYEKLCLKNEWKSHQSLLFLLRDWQNTSYEFGHQGGEKYLTENNDKSLDDYKAMYLTIKKTFETTKCALIPHPGFAITERNEGVPPAKLNDIRDLFLKVCNETFHVLFGNPLVKTMNGQPLTGSDIADLAYTISNLIGKKDFGVDVMLAASASANLQKRIKRCESTFFKSIKKEDKVYQTEELKQNHQVAVKKAITEFDEERKIGNPLDIKQYRKLLHESLEGRLFLFQCYNEVLGTNVKEEHIEMFNKCVKFIAQSFLNRLAILDENHVNQTISDTKQKALAIFTPPASQQRQKEIDTWNTYRTQLEETINAKAKMYRLKNDMNAAKLEIFLRKAAIDAVNGMMKEVNKNRVFESAAKAARKKMHVDKFTVEPTSPIIEINKLKLETDIGEVQKLYSERSSIAEAIALGDVAPLTFAKVREIVASHGFESEETMPQSVLDQVLKQINTNEQGNVLSIVNDMCKNEWSFNHFRWKLEKEKERIAVSEARISGVEDLLKTNESLTKMAKRTERVTCLFDEKVRSISDNTVINHEKKLFEGMLKMITECCTLEQNMYEVGEDEKVNTFLREKLWIYCQEMNKNLCGVGAVDGFITKMAKMATKDFDKDCQSITPNDASREKGVKSFELAIKAQMGEWEKINQFHQKVFPRMTKWGEFVLSAEHFRGRLTTKLPNSMQKPAEVVAHFFL